MVMSCSVTVGHSVQLLLWLILYWKRLVFSFGLSLCAGFDWGRVNFLRSSWYEAMFWICAENSVDNTGMFSLLLSSAYTESRPFLLLTAPHQRGGWGCTRSWEGTQPGQLTPTDQRDIPYRMASCSAYKAGRRRRKGGTFGVMSFVFPSNRYA